MLDIIAGVGARGFLLAEPDCSLILEGYLSHLSLPPSLPPSQMSNETN